MSDRWYFTTIALINSIRMKTRLLSLLLLLGLAGKGHSQSLRSTIAMPYAGLNAYSHAQADAFSFTGNQAALAMVQHAGAGVYAERRFLLSATTSYAAVAVIPTGKGNFGLNLGYAGFKNFNENRLGLAYARHLGKKVALGIQFNHYGYRVPGYQNAAAIFWEAGMIVQLSPLLRGGMQVYNPIGGRLGKNSEEKIASACRMGLGYDASDQFFVSAEIIKEEDKPVNVQAGFQYRFARSFFARAGFLGESGSAFAGAGIGWKNLRLDLSAAYHASLGFSPGILLVTTFKENDE